MDLRRGPVARKRRLREGTASSSCKSTARHVTQLDERIDARGARTPRLVHVQHDEPGAASRSVGGVCVGRHRNAAAVLG